MSEYSDTIVIGGGQAGLAMGHALQTRGQHVVIVDASECVGDAWRQRWDSLALFTPRAYSALRSLPNQDKRRRRDQRTATAMMSSGTRKPQNVEVERSVRRCR